MRARRTTKYAVRYQWAIRRLDRLNRRAERHEDKAEKLKFRTMKYESLARYEFKKMFDARQAEKNEEWKNRGDRG
jgi:uncharacterized protein (DUF342 family)